MGGLYNISWEVYIKSHGRYRKLVDIDEVGIDIDAILIRFNDKILLGKPKLFLLQYCRGNEIDLGVKRPRSNYMRPPKDDLRVRYILDLKTCSLQTLQSLALSPPEIHIMDP